MQFLVPWNYHEPYPGQFKWDGWQDLERWLTIAQELDLMVLIRPGPYICGEWEFGGFPFWLQSSEVCPHHQCSFVVFPAGFEGVKLARFFPVLAMSDKGFKEQHVNAELR